MIEHPSKTAAQQEARVRRWLEEAVIGLNFCPFARPVYVRDQVRIAVNEAQDFDGAIRRTFEEADRLLSASPDAIATTLVVFPEALADFEEFLDAVGVVEQLLDEAGAAGVLQVAHFHPEYCFEGAEPDDLENYTNRAPYPILHLLREADVTEAVESHPAPEAIPDKNIARLEAMGADGVAEMWARWQDQSSTD